ncbi:LysR family transcriptional regulator [Halomonas coralii]|uniref:LysR family transcriptional regulator n=1 Tax=Modicisalibacter sp. R2A 31.J TaxID=2831898 RepID=UPI001CCE6441|nr:LysR family transcriptional regulator [Modicisalibacter sp. R2A 31.J]MBZ9557323.1 LysR family transcriptional regulator [Modicisalibacter sp. R2A 31.J]
MEINRISDIAAFVAAVKAGSYTQAARSVGITRSAIGKAIVRLEARLGVRLLHRTTRRLSLTEEGRILYDRCQQILDDLEEVDEIMASRRVTPSGILKLTAPLSFGQRHVLPLLHRFQSRWPAIQANLSFTDRYVDLIEEGYDIAVRIGEPQVDSRIITRTVAWQHMLTCASPDYLQRRGAPETPAALHEHDTVFFMNADRRRSWRFETDAGVYVFEGPGKLNADSSEAIRESALAGFGLVHLPSYMLEKDLQQGKLVSVLEAYREAAEPIRVIYPSKRHLSPRVRAFIDCMTETWQADDKAYQFSG